MALTAKKVYAILKRQISDMEAKLNSPVRYRGTVATADLLPLNPDIGDMYNIESKSVYGEAGMNVAWNGVVWDTMGAPIDMSLYIKSSELADWVKQQNKPTYTADEVGALPDTTVIPSKTSELQNDSGFLTKIPDNYLSGTDKTLSASGKAADAKATGDKITELSADISNKLNKNQGSENSGKIAGINESGDIVPMFPVSVDYNEETNCLEFGSDQKMELNKGINLDSTLTKTGYAADAGVTGKKIDSLKEDISNKITKFYASNQGETNLQDPDDGKIMDMMLYGRSEQKQYRGKNLLPTTMYSDSHVTNGATFINNGDGSVTVSGTATDITYFTLWGYNVLSDKGVLQGITPGDVLYVSDCFLQQTNSKEIISTISNGSTQFKDSTTTMYVAIRVNKGATVNKTFYPQIEKGSEATSYEPYVGGQPSPSPDYPQEINSVVNPIVKLSNEGGTQFETVTLPYTLNAVPVESGGNVTINGQQYVADYVNVERGKLVKMVDSSKLDNTQSIVNKTEWLLAEPQEIDLTTEEITAFKALTTYYPTTNISVNSEQLDGYTVFNYPISMKNGWDYVKKQLNDNRDYIYNIDTKTQDIDTQAAEAYVNSEYAVALTELEV